MSQTMAKEMTRMSVTGKNFISRHPLDIQNFFFFNLFMPQTTAKEMTRTSVTEKSSISRHPLDIQNFWQTRTIQRADGKREQCSV